MGPPVPKPVLELIERFDRNREAYRSPHYNETQLRREFLDPFFKALGWDMDNEQGYAEAYKDVVHEDAIRIGEGHKAPDYCFRIGGVRKFFVEAKKPAVDIKHDVSPAFQLRRYAWTVKVPLSILSDFEEFAVYDCRIKPDQKDNAAVARILYIPYTEYATRWGEIAAIFSRDALVKGLFDKFAESTRAKRGTADVDDEFLKTIEGWRADLARNLALRNPKLTQRQLNFAVQRIIDRIIFLRICEGRGIEDYGRLRALTNGDRIYPRLCQLFEQADTRYNSGLFHFKPEGGRHEAPDELTLGLEIDDKLLREILKSIYYPDSPYVFSALPTDILGQVYEQFLGKVIRLTEGHQAKVEEKPEVKKAGGVYYTPTYIVDYIVRQTVGKLLDEITAGSCRSRANEAQTSGGNDQSLLTSAPTGQERNDRTTDPGGSRGNETRTSNPKYEPPYVGSYDSRTAARILSRVSKLRILDPACGSGSFLIGAYQYLLDWHRDFYINNNPEKWAKGSKPALVQTIRHNGAPEPNGAGWKLTIAERKRILLNNIYGVDVDTQAVEVTKLSLLLKVLEGETEQTIEPLFRLFHERALPDLGDNIKCGNSLIGPDFYQQQEMNLLDDEERYRINVFDWHAEFPHIFRRNISTGELHETAAASPLDYTTPGVPLHGSYSHKKMKGEKVVLPPAPIESEWEGGFDAVIGNPPYVRMEGFKKLKDYLRSHYSCHEERSDLYAYFIERSHKMLRQHGRFSMIVSNKFLRANYGSPLRGYLRSNASLERVTDFAGLPVFTGATVRTVVLVTRRENRQAGLICYSPPPDSERFKALIAGSKSVEEIVSASAYEVPAASLAKSVWSFGELGAEELLERLIESCVPLVKYCARQICMGVKSGCTEAFVVDHKIRAAILRQNRKAEAVIKPLLNGRDIRRYQINSADIYLIYTYHGIDMSDFPTVLDHLRPFKQKLQSRATKQAWYELQQPQLNFAKFMDGPKIIFPEIATTPRFALDEVGYYGSNTTYFIAKKDLFLLGVLNSALARFYFMKTCAGLEGKNETYLRFFGQYLEGFPVRRIDFSQTADKVLHDRMVTLVEQMLELHQKLASAKTPQEKAVLERQIAATDTQIDRLVYELYGLTDEEIRIVEGEPKNSVGDDVRSL